MNEQDIGYAKIKLSEYDTLKRNSGRLKIVENELTQLKENIDKTIKNNLAVKVIKKEITERLINNPYTNPNFGKTINYEMDYTIRNILSTKETHTNTIESIEFIGVDELKNEINNQVSSKKEEEITQLKNTIEYQKSRIKFLEEEKSRLNDKNNFLTCENLRMQECNKNLENDISELKSKLISKPKKSILDIFKNE